MVLVRGQPARRGYFQHESLEFTVVTKHNSNHHQTKRQLPHRNACPWMARLRQSRRERMQKSELFMAVRGRDEAWPSTERESSGRRGGPPRNFRGPSQASGRRIDKPGKTRLVGSSRARGTEATRTAPGQNLQNHGYRLALFGCAGESGSDGSASRPYLEPKSELRLFKIKAVLRGQRSN